jgi:hypothetical protein
MLNVERRKNGAFRVRMPVPALEFLRRLPGRLRAILENPDFGDSAVRRLFPAAYRDPQKEAEYRQLLADDLARRKLEAVGVFERVLADSQLDLQQAAIEIPQEHFHACLGVINDMRLVLGVELDIREELWEREFDPAGPHGEKLLLLHFLSYVEESLLEATGMVG